MNKPKEGHFKAVVTFIGNVIVLKSLLLMEDDEFCLNPPEAELILCDLKSLPPGKQRHSYQATHSKSLEITF